MTPSRLRAFLEVVRSGSVKAAAQNLGVTESAVSLHVAHLREELDDRLFTRTASGLAFTPGGLRLASRAAEILGLQSQTVREVSQAARGQRLLRLGAASLFAEHAAPGLIDLFAGRADDLQVELSVHPPSQLPRLLTARAIDVAIGPAPRQTPPQFLSTSFLQYQLVIVASAAHPLAGRTATAALLRRQTWLLGPSSVGPENPAATLLSQVAVPEDRQRIFQSDAAALEEAERSHGVAPALRYAVAKDLARGRLALIDGPGLAVSGQWSAMTLQTPDPPSAVAELLRFITTPRATQAMIRGAGVRIGRFRPAVHITLWS